MSLLSCPYCNAVVDAAGQRATCNRCGETFDPAIAEHLTDDSAVSQPAPPLPRPPGFLYSRAAMGLSFGLATAILVIGLAIVRPWRTQPAPTVASKLPVVVSPLGLSGLVYLPSETNIVAAIQPLPLLAYAAQSQTDPRRFLTESGVPESILQSLEAAGVALDRIDHLVVGLQIKSDSPIPGITACLKLTRPLADENQFLARLKAEKNSQRSKGGRTVYSMTLGLPMLLTVVDSKTYLFGFSEADLAAMEKPFSPGGGQLRKDLREALMNRLDPASFAWVATDTQKWSEKPIAKLPFWNDRMSVFESVQAVVAGLSAEDEPRLRLAVRTADKAAATTIRNRLSSRVTGASLTEEEDWTSLVARFDPRAAASWFKD